METGGKRGKVQQRRRLSSAAVSLRGDFAVLGTDYREGRQSRARQLWLKTKENK